jgi:hypothetical protein
MKIFGVALFSKKAQKMLFYIFRKDFIDNDLIKKDWIIGSKTNRRSNSLMTNVEEGKWVCLDRNSGLLLLVLVNDLQKEFYLYTYRNSE